MNTQASTSVALITGGAGFIGTNLAHRLLTNGRRVLILDNLSRPGVQRNLQWLLSQHDTGLEVEHADVLDTKAVRKAVDRASEVYHLAAQVAVTTSLETPLHDFEVNARGTLNVLEAVRGRREPLPLIFTSTNKVYGSLPDVQLTKQGQRYVPVNSEVAARGIDERRPLDFRSPYGCSKGAADQYVLDYARCFGLPTVVFRMSCIYGPHQFGTEDQGWVAHFLIRAHDGQPITLYGDGCQVRDVLFVEDLVDAFACAMQSMERIAGQAFNIGGGPTNTVSLLELLDLMQERLALKVTTRFSAWRNADQRYYVTNPGRFTAATGWLPSTSVQQGIGLLNDWLLASRGQQQPQAPLRAAVQ